jgi:hypothetical protein
MSAISWRIGVCQQLCGLLSADANQALKSSNRLKVAGAQVQQSTQSYWRSSSAIDSKLLALKFSNRLKVAGVLIQHCIREYSAVDDPLVIDPLTWAQRLCQAPMG